MAHIDQSHVSWTWVCAFKEKSLQNFTFISQPFLNISMDFSGSDVKGGTRVSMEVMVTIVSKSVG